VKVEYIDHLGTDLTTSNSARVSFNKTREEFLFDGDPRIRPSGRSDESLIHDLADEGHWTPFSHCVITLRETVPYAIARQRFKHMIGFTYSEVSRRYVTEEPEFYQPDEWRLKPDTKKQGSSERVLTPFDYATHAENDPCSEDAWNAFEKAIETCRDSYHELMRLGVAPELARLVLPQSTYTSYYVTGSLAAFARAYKLRSYSDAQKEIRDLAIRWNEIIRPLYPVSWSALVD
jgi:thymidylate synthase (FAD)